MFNIDTLEGAYQFLGMLLTACAFLCLMGLSYLVGKSECKNKKEGEK